MKTALVVLALGVSILLVGCGAPEPEAAPAESALTATKSITTTTTTTKGTTSPMTEKDYVALLDACKVMSRADCVDADPKGTEPYARRVCSPCIGGHASCCRSEIINGIRVVSCQDNVECHCEAIWNPIFDIVACDYIDEVV